MSTPSLASEGRAWLEYQSLRTDPVYQGDGVPWGDGRPVLVLPGLFANDLYLQPLRSWLERIGYRPLRSTLPVNVGCPERLRTRVERHLASALNDTDRQLTIIGHSRGGMLGKALVSQLGPRCGCFIALGSPLGAILRAGPDGLASMTAGRSAGGEEPAAQAVASAGRRAMRILSPRCEFPACDCRYRDELLAPWPEATRRYSLYSVDDPVVPPGASRLDDAVNIEVAGSHSGLIVNRHLYRHLGAVLAGHI